MSTSAGTSVAYIRDLRVVYESFTPSAPNARLVGVVCGDGCGVLIAILLWYFSSADRVAGLGSACWVLPAHCVVGDPSDPVTDWESSPGEALDPKTDGEGKGGDAGFRKDCNEATAAGDALECACNGWG
eukprot:2794045-Rhodomonas_salina.1